MGTMSSLSQGAYIANSGNYSKGRSGYKICKFTPHIMAGILTGKQCAVNIFQRAGRQASANYCIGNNGDIVCSVYEEDRAWTSSSRSNDCQAITVEVSNCEYGGDWKISEAAWNSLINLAVDVCKRYNFRLEYTGTPSGSLTRHNMFANTSCPGKYLQGRFPELADTVNKILDGGESKPQPKPLLDKHKVGDTVKINGVYTASNSTKKLNPLRDTGTITKIVNGAHNPYLLDNGNLGWVNDSCIVSGESKPQEPEKPVTPTPSTTKYKVGDTVSFNGIYTSSTSTQKLSPSVKSGKITRVIAGAANPYLINNGTGWVNDSVITTGTTSTATPSQDTTIKAGDKVKVKNGAKDYNGRQLISSVYSRTYNVIQVNGDRVVIGIGSAVTAAVHKGDLYKA